MKAIVFGQIGLRKKRFLKQVEAFAQSKGKSLKVFNVGEMMYECDPTIKPGRILQKKINELRNLRARVFDNIMTDIKEDASSDGFVVNSHATFRWENGLFPGFSIEEITKLAPDFCITLIDNIQNIKLSLNFRKQKPEHFTLKDIIVWREEEMLAAEIASALTAGCRNYVVAIEQGPQLIYRLIFESRLPKAYLSYPISLVRDDEEIWNAITDFRNRFKDMLVCFDPYEISESALINEYTAARSQKRRTLVRISVEDTTIRLPLAELEQVIPDIQKQIVARDFKLIEQSDMIVAYIPERDGMPQVSEGVTRELAHAQQCTNDTYVIWPSKKKPSPFLQATRLFLNVDDCCAFLTHELNS